MCLGKGSNRWASPAVRQCSLRTIPVCAALLAALGPPSVRAEVNQFGEYVTSAVRAIA
jgi:hypothetical protein